MDVLSKFAGHLSALQGWKRWLAAFGPYPVTDDATVPEGHTLFVEPGTNVYFAPGAQLTINGTAKGLIFIHGEYGCAQCGWQVRRSKYADHAV